MFEMVGVEGEVGASKYVRVGRVCGAGGVGRVDRVERVARVVTIVRNNWVIRNHLESLTASTLPSGNTPPYLGSASA